MTKPDAMLDDYFRLMAANGADHVYRTAVDTGLLEALRKGPLDAVALATRTALKPAAVSMVLDVLETLGLVAASEDSSAQPSRVFTLTPLAAALLDGPYRSLGDVYWSHLPELLRTGEPMARMDDPAESEARYRGQAAALGWMLAPAAAVAARALAEDGDPEAELYILDAGAGSAIWSLSLAQLRPRSRVTAADWPAVLEVAQATAMRMRLADRLTLLPGDLAATDLPRRTYDVVFLANVAHLLSAEALAGLIQRLTQTLRPSGRLVVVDIFPGQPEGDLHRTLYTLGLALRTIAGQTHHAADVAGLMHDAGLVNATH
ncbi:MAG: methyltransferase, partial [Planctomycetota bacterium]